MSRRIQEFDWSQNTLGPISSWSPTLKTIVRFLLANRFPLLLWWGPQFVQIYNDAYIPVLGTKHPTYLGRPTQECWAEIWNILQPLIETPFRGGPPTWMEDIQLEINRYGFLEESHFTIAYSPVPDDTVAGGIGGVLATVHEISEKVVAERRIVVLRDLGTASVEAKSGEAACSFAAESLAQHAKDIPFALFYLIDPDRKYARLAGSVGVSEGTAMSPRDMEMNSDSIWDFAHALRTESVRTMDNLSARFGNAVPQGPWAGPPQQAAIAPIRSSIPHQPSGFLIFGLSSRLRFDESYRNFIELATSQISTGISNARAYEEEKRRAEALAVIARSQIAQSQKDLQQALDASEKASRVKDEFLATVSHELRTPLNAILGWAHMLQSRTIDPSVAGSAVSAIYASAKAQAQLIDDLLDVGRITTGKMTLEPQKIVLDDALSHAVSTLGHAIRAKNLHLHLEYSKGSQTTALYADPQRLQQVFWNLLSNAVKFTPDSGTIEIVVVRTQSEVIIAFRDTGIGIPKEFLPFVFERFRQMDSSTSRKFGGLGLGMSIAKNLVELHGGTISVHSEGSEKGTTFRVVLPLFEPEKAEGPLLTINRHNEPVYDIQLSETRVMLVDDDVQTLQLMREAFEYCGAETRICKSATESYEILKSWIPDLLISDIAMPYRDGYWLIHEVRSLPNIAYIPAIALTAYSTTADRASVLAAGFDMFVAKPIEPAELLSTAKTLLEHPTSPVALASMPDTSSVGRASLPGTSESELAGKKILLIEDDLLSVEALRMALEREGSECRSAIRASQALDTVQNWVPDLIVSDLGLPDEDGYTLIKKIHALGVLGAPIPSIALTGYGKQEGERALAAGFHVYRSKPVEPATLISLLKEIIRNRPYSNL